MPKLSIRNFSGGLVTNQSEFDISESQYVVFNNFLNKMPGRLEKFNTDSTASAGITSLTDVQTELVLYRTEKNAADADVSTTWWVVGNGTVLRRQDTSDGTGGTFTDISTGWSSNPIYDFLVHNQILRISDGSFSNNTKWFGHIKRDVFGANLGLTSFVPYYLNPTGDATVNDWFVKDAALTAPTIVKMSMAHDGSNELNASTKVGIFVYEPRTQYGDDALENDEHNAWVNALDNETFDPSDRYTVTYLYDYVQESDLARDADGNIGVSGFEVASGSDDESDSGVTLATSAMTDTGSEVLIGSGNNTLFKPYTYIKINSEIMFIKRVRSDRLNVRRAQLNTQVSEHAVGDSIFYRSSPQKGRAINVVLNGLTTDGYHDPRITGLNIYWQPKGDVDWYLVETLDINRGYSDSVLATTPDTLTQGSSDLAPYVASDNFNSDAMKNYGYWVACPNHTALDDVEKGKVTGITVTNGGTGYTAGSFTVDNTGTGGSGFAATYTTDVSGTIGGTTITNAGGGYTTAPTLTPDTGGSSANITATISSISSTNTGWRTSSGDFNNSSSGNIGIASRKEFGDSGLGTQFNRIGAYFTKVTGNGTGGERIEYSSKNNINRVFAMQTATPSHVANITRVTTHAENTAKVTCWYIPYDGMKLATFNSLTGRAAETKLSSIKWNTSAVVNNRGYYADVDTVDENEQTAREKNRVYYTDQYKLDEVIPGRYFDVGRNDGDEIKKLMSYMNKLFVFKTRNVYVYDRRHRLERSFSRAGAVHKHAVTETPMGLVCANRSGVYMVNTSSSKELSFPIRDTYQSLGFGNFTIVGCDSKENELYVLADDDGSASYVMNMDNGSWSYRAIDATNQRTRSNYIQGTSLRAQFFNVTTGASAVKRVGAGSTSSTTALLVTKRFDLGTPDVQKRFNKIIMTYQSGASITVNVYVDAGYSASSATETFDFPTKTALVTESMAIRAVGKSIQLMIGAASDSLKIDTIEIEYDLLGSNP
tara:strand:- start:1400 stop:4378 length:2979 start_codon:yes stop_codon:yes gene_type:complete